MPDLMMELLGALFTMALSFSVLMTAANADILGISNILPDTVIFALSITAGIIAFLYMRDKSL